MVCVVLFYLHEHNKVRKKKCSLEIKKKKKSLKPAPKICMNVRCGNMTLQQNVFMSNSRGKAEFLLCSLSPSPFLSDLQSHTGRKKSFKICHAKGCTDVGALSFCPHLQFITGIEGQLFCNTLFNITQGLILICLIYQQDSMSLSLSFYSGVKMYFPLS